MTVRLDKPKVFSDAINVISEIVTEVRIKLESDGMSIVAVDPANVAMIVFKLPKERFSQYISENEVWGVNLADLKMVMRRASSGGSVVFEQEENQLKITIFDKIKRIFNMALIEIESEDKDAPDLNFSCKVEMDSSSFSQSIEDCAVVADSCALSCGNGFFVIEGSGSLNSARAEFSGDEVKIEGVGRAKYSLEYLKKFIKAEKIADRVVINFADNHPLSLDFPGDELGIRFILAPRVEND